jgi:drug/metabolite transporter (DMT)-like permease
MGLLAALLWGGGDFSGGMGAKHAGGTPRGALRVILLSHSTSLAILLLVLLLHGGAIPQGAPLLWGLAAGVAGGLSLTLFYIALARGAMGASAAISGLLAAAIPALFSIISDGSPGAMRLTGFAVAGTAIWMIAAAPASVLEIPGTKPAISTLVFAVLAGAGFGVYFIALKFAGAAGVVWPMAAARVGSLATCGLLLIALTGASRRTHELVRLPKKAVLWCLATALLDTSGNMLFISATRAGRLDVAAVLASLYPASTILLAGWLLRERFSGLQKLGMGAAVVAVVLITL